MEGPLLYMARQKRQQVDKAEMTDLHEIMDTHGESVGVVVITLL